MKRQSKTITVESDTTGRRTHQEILETAILLARANGYKYPFSGGMKTVGTLYQDEIFGIIFNHDFAKALWGEDWPETPGRGRRISPGIGSPVPRWQTHLKGMVIAEDPIQYLGDNLDG